MLYINDMIDYLMEAKINIYADNIALYYSNSSIIELMDVLSREMASG